MIRLVKGFYMTSQLCIKKEVFFSKNYIIIVFSKQSIMKGLNAGSKLSPKNHKDMLSPKVYSKMPILIWYCNVSFKFML